MKGEHASVYTEKRNFPGGVSEAGKYPMVEQKILKCIRGMLFFFWEIFETRNP